MSDSNTKVAVPSVAAVGVRPVQDNGKTSPNHSISNGKLSVNKALPTSCKRKASEESLRRTEKISKKERETDLVKPRNGSIGGIATSSSGKPMITKNTSTSSFPSQGVGGPNAAAPSSTVPKAPPKKGSFAEIMARAGKSSTATIGVITHKPKEKPKSRREIESQKQELALRSKKGVDGRSPNSTPGHKVTTPGPRKQLEKGQNVEKASIASSGYQGTAKPKPQPTYKGTISSRSPASGVKRPTSASTGKNDSRSSEKSLKFRQTPTQRRRRSIDDEDDEASDNRYTYADSDEDFPDMDAGFYDVEEEDATAARLARAEDVLEQKRLDGLKNQKEERKKILASLARKANKR